MEYSIFKHAQRTVRRWFERRSTHAQRVAEADLDRYNQLNCRHFSLGRRPVMRWVKGNGLDDAVTRVAIAQATRLFGADVDYCLCTNDIDAARVREILAWSSQPVEWWPVGPGDNQPLAALLANAGCTPDRFGYWWKWFPDRVRPDAPEWILDGDMVVTAKPDWFEQWLAGKDRVRVSQDDRQSEDGSLLYGQYADLVDRRLALYSGFVSLPPAVPYMDHMCSILRERPLAVGHDGRKDMCEQGVVAACFQSLDPVPIPLNEFPFGRAFEEHLDYGICGDVGKVWGYHFGHAFRGENRHFEMLVQNGTLYNSAAPGVIERANWLEGFGQWGVPGWSAGAGIASLVLRYALDQPHRDVLELGTSRGHMTAVLAESGFRVLTVDRVDRGATQNLEGLSVEVVQAEASAFLKRDHETHSLIVMDLHGNSPQDWARYRRPLMSRLRPGGTLLINNALLHRIPEWREETGVSWFLSRLPRNWTYIIDDTMLPGLAIVRKPEER